MATTCGKKMRRKYGNRYACKKRKSHRTSPEKQEYWQALEAQRLRREHERMERRRQ